MVSIWINHFREVGPDALRPYKKTLDMLNDKQNNSNKISCVDTSAEHVKELEDELYNLRIENALLKELRRLHLEDEVKKKMPTIL